MLLEWAFSPSWATQWEYKKHIAKAVPVFHDTRTAEVSEQTSMMLLSIVPASVRDGVVYLKNRSRRESLPSSGKDSAR